MQRPGRFTRGKDTRYSLYRKQGRPQGRIERVRKISPPPGFDRRTVHLVASRYSTTLFRNLLYITNMSFMIFLEQQPSVGQGILIDEVSRSHTTTHHTRQDSSGRVISSSQRPLPDNTQHSQQTDIHAPGGIRTHNLSRRAAVDLHLRQRGHWDRHYKYDKISYCYFSDILENTINLAFGQGGKK